MHRTQQALHFHRGKKILKSGMQKHRNHSKSLKSCPNNLLMMKMLKNRTSRTRNGVAKVNVKCNKYIYIYYFVHRYESSIVQFFNLIISENLPDLGLEGEFDISCAQPEKHIRHRSPIPHDATIIEISDSESCGDNTEKQVLLLLHIEIHWTDYVIFLNLVAITSILLNILGTWGVLILCLSMKTAVIWLLQTLLEIHSINL